MTRIECCGRGHGQRCEFPPCTPAPLHDYLADEIRIQRQMIADLIVGTEEHPMPREFGALHPCGVDRATGKPYTLGDLFDRHALAMLCIRLDKESAKEDEAT